MGGGEGGAWHPHRRERTCPLKNASGILRRFLADLLFIFHLIGEKKLVEGTGYNDLNHTRAASMT